MSEKLATLTFTDGTPPMDLQVLGNVLDLSRTAVYTLGFFMFWSFAAASSALTCFLQRDAEAINRLCPLPPGERPAGCPRSGLTENLSQHP